MTLLYAREVNKQTDNGSFVKAYDDLTVCETCIVDNEWGYTVYVDDVPGEKCELCGASE